MPTTDISVVDILCQEFFFEPGPEYFDVDRVAGKPGSYQHARVSGAGELHPRALAEPDVNLSAHTAPIAEPRCTASCQ